MEKEQLAQWLTELDENVLQVAIMYAENYLKYGVDVAEKWNTATKQQYALYEAERRGFADGQKYAKGTIVCCKDCRMSNVEKVFKNVPESKYTVRWCKLISRCVDDDWFCADGRHLKDGDH